jgi:signal transduction histidine kinase/CheY-like chemotaxis protein
MSLRNITAIIALFLLTGCFAETQKSAHDIDSSIKSYRDIPGVTAEEITAIEAFKAEGRTFSYGSMNSTEAFKLQDGTNAGFAALFCKLLSDLFGIPFIQKKVFWDDQVRWIGDMSLDFSSDMTPTPERMKRLFMTHSIAERSLGIFFHENNDRFQAEEDVNGLKLGFYAGGITAQSVMKAYPSLNFEIIELVTIHEAAESIASGRIDALVNDAVTTVDFEDYPFVHSREFFPLVYTPVSMTTGNPALAPVISVVDKYIEAGGIDKLFELYRKGRYEYAKYELSRSYTDAETAYITNLINSGAQVPVGLEYDYYPVCFFNEKEGAFQGIVPDILREITLMTGIEFEVKTDKDTPFYRILEMVNAGEIAFLSAMLMTPERRTQYLWSERHYAAHYALISKIDYPSLEMPQVVRARVGVNRGSAYEEMYRSWFPNNTNLVRYDSIFAAMMALDKGEVDLVMASENALITMTNYFEKPGFMINILFNAREEAYFGFNRNEELLASIIRKSQKYIALEKINKYWTNRMFDYTRKLAEAQRPWLVGATVLLVITLALILVIFFRNRSEGKRLAGLVAEQTGEVRNASEAKSRFIANMSHEMRTPMNVIVGFTDLLLEDEATPDKTRDMLKKINTAGNTLMGLINDVLDISKIEAGRLELAPVHYDVPSLLNDIITLNTIRIEDKPVTFKLDIDEKLPCSLFGDDLRVKQILNNLLSNAFKYTREGTVTLNVTSRREGDTVLVFFSVSDTGIGIRAEDMLKLFSDYNQVDTSAHREIEGTGLGLSITKKFVEMMNGEITVESEYGKGSTFRVHICQGFVTDTPIGAETVENLRGFRYTDEKIQAHEKLVRSDLSYARVLVVDDFPTNLDVAAGMLRKYQMQVDCVTSGQEAIDRIAAGEPVYNAVFMDHMMPGMDGIEATAAMRAMSAEYAKNIPIIALTANAVAGNEQMFLANGFNAFLPKPFSVMSLDSVVQRWVRKK